MQVFVGSLLEVFKKEQGFRLGMNLGIKISPKHCSVRLTWSRPLILGRCGIGIPTVGSLIPCGKLLIVARFASSIWWVANLSRQTSSNSVVCRDFQAILRPISLVSELNHSSTIQLQRIGGLTAKV